ncbi:nitroreductase [Tepidimonas sp.]|uniref:nitroreductase family protein n=1 Tax=Tepidimonas sp. TaxID=2002775 RepID=UPI003918F46D
MAPTSGPWREGADWALEWITRRQTVLPKRLVEPGPSAAEIERLLTAAAAAPDHGQLMPWRFIDVPVAARDALGDVFAQALRERDPTATVEQQAQAREKARRAPLLWLLVVDARPHVEDVPVRERLISAGCAVQNVMLMATAMGYGSALTSGKALDSAVLRQAFALSDADMPVCFLSIGTVGQARPARVRPAPMQLLSVWAPGSPVGGMA